jgi:hypothetical protein
MLRFGTVYGIEIVKVRLPRRAEVVMERFIEKLDRDRRLSRRHPVKTGLRVYTARTQRS